MSASRSSGTTDALGPDEDPEEERAGRGCGDGCANGGVGGTGHGAVSGAPLLAALLDGMDAALCAFDVHGTITHWNREAERFQ